MRRPGQILLSTHLDREAEPVESTVAIRRDEGVIIKLGDARSRPATEPASTSALSRPKS